MAGRELEMIRGKTVMFSVMFWLWSPLIVAYSPLQTLGGAPASSSNLSKDDRNLTQYVKILQPKSLRVSTNQDSLEEAAPTIIFNGEGTTAFLKEIPVGSTSESSKTNKKKLEAPLMSEQALSNEKQQLTSSGWYPREQDKKEQEKTIHKDNAEASNHTENTDKDLDNLDMENTNLETRNLKKENNSILDESDSEKEANEDSATEKAVDSVLKQALKLVRQQSLKSFNKVPEKLIPKPHPRSSMKRHQKPLSVSSLKVLEEAFQKGKPASLGDKSILGQIALVAPLVTNSPGSQEQDLGTEISQSSKKDQDQPNKKQLVENQILKKITDINAEIKHTLETAKYPMEFKGDAKSAQKYLIQSLSLVERKKKSINGHKLQKLPKEKVDGEKIRFFINFVYNFKSQLTAFLNMNNIPVGLRGKATTVRSIIETLLCGKQQNNKTIIKKLLEENIKMLNRLNITLNP
ncbi:uncharacterized protein LOC141497383 [Macrotis lagotis]|uniref:uncharacterized protein LOC141497383 n=1 Tax=Macrotis lagotis TaxID=92651 RepID=UPI003D682420